MRKPRLIFFIIYFIFHLAFLAAAISVYYKSEDFEFLLWLRSKMDVMIYIAILGLLLFFTMVVLITMDINSRNKEKAKLEQEVNSLKAKMFDLQEATRVTPVKPQTEKKLEEGQE